MGRKRDFFHTGLNVSRSDLAGMPWSMYGANPTGAQDYFVDGNALVSEDGKHWDTPSNSLEEVITLSNADMANSQKRWWARRNRIFIVSDDMVEDLDILPQKCDIIGLGSSDPYKMACIRGNHVPITTGSGCRFINLRFRPTAAEDLFILTSVLMGVEFHNCLFDAHYGAFTAPSAIDATAHQALKIMDCDFLGEFSGDVIDIGAGHMNMLRIVGNTIMGGADNGIVATGTMTVEQGRYGLIANNIIKVADKVIDDGSDDVVFIANNSCQSDEAAGASAYVINNDWAVNNIICCSDEVIMIPQLSNVVA